MTFTQWPQKRLETLCHDITVGHVGTMSHEFVEDGIPLLRGQNIRPYRIDLETDVKYISENFHNKLQKSRLQAGDVVAVRVGYPGVAAMIPAGLGPLNCASLVVIRPNSELLSSCYLTYFLNSPLGKAVIKARLVGAAQQVFNITSAAALDIPYPPISVQRRIAHLLSAHDDLIENNTKRIKILEEMARSLYREWFVHFRFPGHEKGHVADLATGAAPQGWKRTRVAELVVAGSAEITTGPFGTQLHASDYVETGTPVINVRNIGFGYVRQEKLEYISDETIARLRQHLLQPEDIVFGRKGAVERHILVRRAQSNWFQGSDCLRLRIRPGSGVSPYVLSQQFLTADHQQWMKNQCSHGATMASLNQAIIGRIPVLLAPEAILKEAEEQLHAFNTLAERLREQSDVLRRTRDLLLPRLISGEIDVSSLPFPADATH